MADINSLLKKLDGGSIREINDFLNSARGERLKHKLGAADKEKLLKKLSEFDEKELDSRLRGMGRSDIIRALNRLGK